MMTDTDVTSGGWRGMSGTQRRLALALGAGFLLILTLIMVANAESSISDLAASGAHIRSDLVWSWEWTSMLAWLSVCPLLWIGVARVRPPRFSWPVVVAILLSGSVVASAWHIVAMILLRRLYYDAVGQGPYHFFGVVNDRLLYEYRKDLATYVQFVGLAAIAQWLIARAAPPAVPAPATLAVVDGTVTHRVPADEIEWIGSAGNYVEIAWTGRILLHRATLASVGEELGDAFVRIHRGRLVRRAAIRRVETDRSGDFTVELASGASVKGSRRYRASL